MPVRFEGVNAKHAKQIERRPMSVRNGFYAGALLAFAIGIYLFQLWQPERQVRLHSEHLLRAIEQKSWPTIGEFIDPTYADRWGHDRDLLLARLRFVLPYARNLQLVLIASDAHAVSMEGNWSARVTVEADPNEVTALIKDRINTLDAPFDLHWRRFGKPWEWKLVRVENAALELPESNF